MLAGYKLDFDRFQMQLNYSVMLGFVLIHDGVPVISVIDGGGTIYNFPRYQSHPKTSFLGM
jgi:hypothetical protein